MDDERVYEQSKEVCKQAGEVKSASYRTDERSKLLGRQFKK